MAKIYLKKGDSIEVTENEAEQIKVAIPENRGTDMVEIGNQSIRYSLIDRVILDKDEKAEQQWIKAEQEYLDEYYKHIAKSPEEKTDIALKNHVVMLLRAAQHPLYQNPQGKLQLTPTDIEKLKPLAIQFFKEHPRRTILEPKVIFTLLAKDWSKDKEMDKYNSALFRAFENCLYQDRKMANDTGKEPRVEIKPVQQDIF